MTRVEKLKTLLGIATNEKDFIIEFILNKASDMICNYCHIESVPMGLENVMLNMAIDLYRSERLGQEEMQGAVKSISEGDVTVSFSSASSISENPSMAFLKDYTKQLDRYRKVGW